MTAFLCMLLGLCVWGCVALCNMGVCVRLCDFVGPSCVCVCVSLYGCPGLWQQWEEGALVLMWAMRAHPSC